MKNIYLFLSLFCFAHFASAQIQVNAYARVTSISGNSLQLSQVDEAFDSFEDGEKVLIIQVQDDVIGANTANTSSFGELDQILNAGNFEIAQISSHTESAGTPTNITLQNTLIRPYSTGPNSRLQIVSFPQLGSPNYTTTSDITAKAWDGQTGGVLAFEVLNQLTLAHNISADGLGFRGGAVSRNQSGAICSSHGVYISSSDEYGAKGEGIYPNTNANYTYARAKMLNGGGGGGHHNGGGAGGGNYTEGGEGGRGYNGGSNVCPAATAVGGQAGIALAAQIAPNRVFLGGGGGGGQQNNSRGTAGANGGGMIYIKAQEIISPASCSGISISANGNDAASWRNDGAGGGGAGGSVLLDVNSFNIDAACPLLIEASGGTGGTSNSTPHGGGGGGGQGVIFYSTNTNLTTNVSSRTDNGLAGCNDYSSPCNNFAGSPSGINGDGIFYNVLLLLELSYFKAQKQDEKVLLSWGVSSSDQTTLFELQRAADGLEFEAIAQIPAQFNQTDYTFLDADPIKGQSYYRLLQIGENEEEQYSIIQAVYLEQMTNAIQLWPNPAKNELYLASEQLEEITQLELLDLQGRKQTIQYQKENNRLHIQWMNLPQGIYFLQITGKNFYQTKKVQIH